MSSTLPTPPASGAPVAGQGSVSPSQMSDAAYRQAALNALGEDPQPGFSNPEDQPGNDKPGFWSRIGKTLRTIDRQATFGLADAVNSASDALVGTAVGISKRTGLYKIGKNDQEEQQFLDWWSKPTKEANPLHFSDDVVSASLGGAQRGEDSLSHWSQMAGQILGALAGAKAVGVGELGSGTARLLGAGKKLMGLAGRLVEGAFIDGTFFDPYQARFSNLLEHLSDKFGLDAPKRAFALLAANPNDSEIEARAKAVLEGAGLGVAVEQIFRLVKVFAKATFLKTSTDEAAKKQVAQSVADDLAQVADQPKVVHDPDAKMTRVANEDGTATLIHNDDEADIRALAGETPEAPLTPRERRTARIAFTDANTGLRNKAALHAALANTPEGSVEHVMMDAAALKAVNDRTGEAAGDAYLKRIAEAMKTAGSELGIKPRNLFHQSGDEFSALVPPGQGQPFLARVQELVGTQPIEGEATKVMRIDGGVGATRDAADKALHDFKTGRAEGFQRDANGMPDVLPMGERGGDLAAEKAGQQSFTFGSTAEADQVLHATGDAVRRAREPMFTPEQVAQFKQEMASVTSEAEATGLFQRWGTHFNFRWNSAPAETLASIEAMSRQMPEAADLARALGTQPHGVTVKLAQDIFRDTPPEQAIALAKKLFGDTKELPQQLLSLKMHLVSAGNEVRRLSDLVDTQPNNPVVMDQMVTAMDNLWELHQRVAGAGSNAGRTLDALQIDPQEALGGLTPEAAAARQADELVAEGANGGKAPAGEAVPAPKASAAKGAKGAPSAPDVAPERVIAEDTADKLDQQATTEATSALDEVKTAIATNKVGASDFSLARLRQRLERAHKALENLGKDRPVFGPDDPEAVAKRSKAILEAADKQRTEPLPGLTPAEKDALEAEQKAQAGPKNPIEEMSFLLDGALKEVDRVAKKVASGIEKRNIEGRVGDNTAFTADSKSLAETPVDNLFKDEKARTEVLKPLLDIINQSQKELDRIKARAAKNAEKRALAREKTASRAFEADAKSAKQTPFDVLKRETLSSKMSRQELRDLARTLRLTEGDPSAVLDALYGARFAKAARELKNPSLWDKAIQFRMFAMLSHWVTWKVNAVSNTLAAVAKPAELWVGSAFNRLRGIEGAAEGQRFAADQFVGLWSELSDAWQAAARAAEVGDNLLDRNHKYFDTQGQTLSNLSTGLSGDGQAVGAITRAYEVPSRVLMSTDEFFKQLNYRAHVRAQALQAARQAGITDTKQIAERVESSLRGSFAGGGNQGALNPNALEYARVATFTNPLEEGTIGAKLQQAVIKHPTLRMIFPFVRTPVNLLKWTWHRTPGLANLSAEFRQEMQAGGARAAAAQGQIALGGALYATAAMATAAGHVTGRGPSNPALRKEWLNAGNKPYSFRIPGTDVWVPYFRADPVLTPVGLAADAVTLGGETAAKLTGEVDIAKAERKLQGASEPTDPMAAFLATTADLYHAAGNLSAEDWTNASAAVFASILANVSSKTFLRSATDFADAVGSGDPGKFRRFAGSMATSFVPNFLTNEGDPYYREARGVVDELLKQTPWSEHVEPSRNLLGEPVLRAPETVGSPFNPFTPQAGKTDPLLTQLLDLGRAIPMPSSKIGTIDLGDRSRWGENNSHQSPYDRMLELLAHPQGGMPSLRDALTGIVNSPGYKTATDGTVAEPGGTRFRMVMGIIEAYRQVAEAQMLQEYPKLQRALNVQTVVRGTSSAAGEEGAAQARLLFQTQQPQQQQ